MDEYNRKKPWFENPFIQFVSFVSVGIMAALVFGALIFVTVFTLTLY